MLASFHPLTIRLCLLLLLCFSLAQQPTHARSKRDKQTTKRPPKKLLTFPKAMQAQLSRFQALRKRHLPRGEDTRRHTFPDTLLNGWLKLLWSLKKYNHTLTGRQIKAFRRMLALKSDVDRNRYYDFPTDLSNKIIHSILACNRILAMRRQRHRKPAPRTTKRSSRLQPLQRHAKLWPSRKRNKLLPLKQAPTRYTNMALGDEGSLAKWLPKREAFLSKDASHSPPLVFTQKDLKRFRGPARFLSWPIRGGRVSSRFGWRRDPFTKRLRMHKGIDLRASFGTSVYAAAPGRVVRSGWLGSCGMAILLRHVNGYSTYYCHLSQILASRGKYVKRGQLIGKIGSTGRSTAPHLHFSLLRYRRAIDPLPHISSK